MTEIRDLERGFHNRDGWFFRRDDDAGTVRLWKVRWEKRHRRLADDEPVPEGMVERIYNIDHDDHTLKARFGDYFEPVLEVGPHTIHENEWASIVASVSRGGETGASWQAVRDFHAGASRSDALAAHLEEGCRERGLCEAVEAHRKHLIDHMHVYENLLRDVEAFLDSIEWTDSTSETNAANLSCAIQEALAPAAE